MEAIQDGRHTKEIIGSLCPRYCMLNKYDFEMDTDAHYVSFVKRILGYVAFSIFNKFIFNICINSAFFFSFLFSSYSIIKQKHTVLLPNPSVKIKITIHTSTTQFHCSNLVQS